VLIKPLGDDRRDLELDTVNHAMIAEDQSLSDGLDEIVYMVIRRGGENDGSPSASYLP